MLVFTGGDKHVRVSCDITDGRLILIQLPAQLDALRGLHVPPKTSFFSIKQTFKPNPRQLAVMRAGVVPAYWGVLTFFMGARLIQTDRRGRAGDKRCTPV